MSAQGFPDRHTTTTTTSVVRVTRPYFDPSYIRTLPGILKVAQAVSNKLILGLRNQSPKSSSIYMKIKKTFASKQPQQNNLGSEMNLQSQGDRYKWFRYSTIS